ncbi:hypothetical protein BKA67DRAFT_534185 [Truncatella angustata]|uniref:Uncharacterized protein n=1 Tax=Truncatella angustata TaxID=152316 RepID=A0A9P8ZZQ3_9PEZI|nr:uncharacterized protein BKA67DRAFT_534185 [Truncatella angustata]KAH6655254.1 hypothetical protein BKA67DRAFT_534185 [Truncatella angustata]KAH8198952.1 hypothetical protein TruAng_006871 [Truncatella angustata]
MAFLEDPRLRQRWNQISHTTEAVTENAAAGIWTFGHQYINPCFASIGAVVDSCTAPCFGDHEERARRKREREREAEYSFDFYDDWDEDLVGDSGQGGFGAWRNEDWERLIGGSGASKSQRAATGEIQEQPHGRKRGMSYGTRGTRRKSSVAAEDPTIIPSTQPIGFLGKLPFKIKGTLRYKPSAANLQDHPGASRHLEGENQPLLGHHEEEYHPHTSLPQTRKRSGTTSSGDTSDSYRSRGDLFPSDEEGEEDAVPLDDEFAVALDRVDDRSSNRTKSSKGKRTASYTIPRSVSRTTIGTITPSRPTSLRQVQDPISDADEALEASTLSLKDLLQEEEQIQREEDEEIERKRHIAAHLAMERGLQRDNVDYGFVPEAKPELIKVENIPTPEQAEFVNAESPSPWSKKKEEAAETTVSQAHNPDQTIDEFVPARLPYFR